MKENAKGTVRVAKLSDIPPGTARCVEVGGQAIAIFNLEGELHAIADECNHVGGPLSEGFIRGDEVECPWHGARFKIKTGAACSEPADGDAQRFVVHVRGDDVEIEL